MPVAEPTGIVCGSGATAFEVLDTSIRTVRGIRYYSADGLLLRRHFNDYIDGTLTNSVSGATVTYHQRGTHLHDLATPGDSSSGVERSTGSLRAFSDNGTVLIDVGRDVESLADGTLLFEAGQHPIGAYFTGDVSALQPLCDALAD